MRILSLGCAFLTLAVSAAVPAQAVRRVNDQKGLDRAANAVVAAIRRNDWRGLGALIDPRRGLTIYHLFGNSPQTFPAASWRRALASRRELTWAKAWDGDGGRRPPVRQTLREFLDSLNLLADWRKPTKRTYDRSDKASYRSLFVQDLKRKHSGVRFVDLVIGNPKIPEMREFDHALMLGFVPVGGGRGYRLAVLGTDYWKD